MNHEKRLREFDSHNGKIVLEAARFVRLPLTASLLSSSDSSLSAGGFSAPPAFGFNVNH
jgi:hypothetical protein